METGDSRWLFWVLPAFFVANCLVLIVVVLLQSGKARILLAPWRCWQPNRFRSSRRCQRSLQGHHVVRRHVYALRLCHGAAYG